MADALRPRFWDTVPLRQMTGAEWEALCDGCGKCCLNKLEDEDTGQVDLTRVSCRLLDTRSCRCKHYQTRRAYVPECIQLTAQTIDDHLYWLPQTCAYRLLHIGQPLPDWHPLITGDAASVAQAGVSVAGLAISEEMVDEDDWDDHIIEEPL